MLTQGRLKPFIAQIKIAGRVRRIGTFDTIEEASGAYQRVAREHFGEYAA